MKLNGMKSKIETKKEVVEITASFFCGKHLVLFPLSGERFEKNKIEKKIR